MAGDSLFAIAICVRVINIASWLQTLLSLEAALRASRLHYALTVNCQLSTLTYNFLTNQISWLYTYIWAIICKCICKINKSKEKVKSLFPIKFSASKGEPVNLSLNRNYLRGQRLKNSKSVQIIRLPQTVFILDVQRPITFARRLAVFFYLLINIYTKAWGTEKAFER